MGEESNDVRNSNDLGLQKTVQRFRQLADWAPVSLAIFDRNMRYIDLTQGWRDACQIGDRNVVGLSHYEIFPDLPEQWKDVHRRCLDGATERCEADLFLRPDGTSGWIRWEVKPWSDDCGNIGGIVMWTEDITARMQGEVMVRNSERRFRAALANSQVVVWEQDLQLRYTWIHNPKLGYAAGEVIGKTDAELIDPAYAKELEALKRRVIETGQSTRQDVAAVSHDLHPEYYDLSIDPIRDAAGQIVGISCAATEITERRQVAQELRVLVSEKESLIKEVHHRVKNNLQVISSLLRLESRRSLQPDSKAVLGDMQARIHAMALLHETLYRSGSFASVDLGNYLRQLANQALQAQRTDSNTVQMELDLGSVQVGMDQAISCGLLTNELISNSLKHGFPTGATGIVRIDLQRLGSANQWQLRVSDDGVGLPENFEEKRHGSLGLQLVEDLVRQIGGELKITQNQDKGAAFTVNFLAIEPAPLVMPV